MRYAGMFLSVVGLVVAVLSRQAWAIGLCAGAVCAAAAITALTEVRS